MPLKLGLHSNGGVYCLFTGQSKEWFERQGYIATKKLTVEFIPGSYE